MKSKLPAIALATAALLAFSSDASTFPASSARTKRRNDNGAFGRRGLTPDESRNGAANRAANRKANKAQRKARKGKR